jgi:hypothetical protein
MRVMIAVCALAFISFSANAAEWKIIWKADSVTHLINPSRTTKIGPIAKFWEQQNFLPNKAGGRGSSILLHREIDCANQRHRTLAFKGYKEPYLEGSVWISESFYNVPNAWEYIEPSSVEEVFMREVCKR